eukprot:NODE_23051_length_682_cov_3.942342.p1 GENE.NODE_23051_length_682_cov_3.942342~~NODE_23051_length_682_cov_3.942342.p1  ORF type:complete len:200 (+),score=16.02 NODE_23051_length_682_cov_3.942342:70-669(+)
MLHEVVAGATSVLLCCLFEAPLDRWERASAHVRLEQDDSFAMMCTAPLGHVLVAHLAVSVPITAGGHASWEVVIGHVGNPQTRVGVVAKDALPCDLQLSYKGSHPLLGSISYECNPPNVQRNLLGLPPLPNLAPYREGSVLRFDLAAGVLEISNDGQYQERVEGLQDFVLCAFVCFFSYRVGSEAWIRHPSSHPKLKQH